MTAAPTGFDRRLILAAGLATALPFVAHARPAKWDIVISKSGRRGTVPTLAAALDAARTLGRPCRIRLETGVYEEKIILDVPDVHLEGEGPGSILSFGAAAGHKAPDGKNWGTGRTGTLIVTAPGVTLANLTIRNSFDYLDDRRTGASGGSQAVALCLGRGADRARVLGCVLEGYQDTFYLQEGVRALVLGCTISGNVDFIFGGAFARFEQCEIRSRYVPDADPQGYVAAPSTPASKPVGLVFDRCRLTREAGLPDNSVWLGRPWRAGGNMALTGYAAFVDCWMDAHIQHAGWTSMGYTNPAGERTALTPQEARLFEYGSRGPGAGAPADTRRMLSEADVNALRAPDLFGDWRPA